MGTVNMVARQNTKQGEDVRNQTPDPGTQTTCIHENHPVQKKEYTTLYVAKNFN